MNKRLIQRISGTLLTSEGPVKYAKWVTVACVRDAIFDMTTFATEDVVRRISTYIYKKGITKLEDTILIRKEWFDNYYADEPYFSETERVLCTHKESKK